MITKKINGFVMFLDPEDGGISKILAKRGIREPCFMWIIQKEASGHLGIDVGANIGYTTLHLCGAMDKVIAIEPDPRSRKLLIKNLEANDFKDTTQIYDFAVSDKNAKQTICFADKPNLTTLYDRPDLKGQKREILTRTIDSLNVLPNFIKMDIEGYEVEALSGAMQCLKETKYCKILVEVHPQFFIGERFEAILRKLLDIGFKFKYVVSAGVPQPDLFKKHGYKPVPKTPVYRRAIYDCVSPEHAIEWSSYSIEQKYKKGKISPKIIRSILLVKDER
ncbi:FkbM family methyltransferase [Planctomycetota bacterium]